MTQPFDPLSGLITAICLLFLSGAVVGCIAGWMAHWWSARQPHAPFPTPDTNPSSMEPKRILSTAGAAYDADIREEDATPLCVRQAEDVAAAALEGKSSWYEGESKC